MKLYDKFADYVLIGRKKCHVNFSFDCVLHALAYLNNDNLTDWQKIQLITPIIAKKKYKHPVKLINAYFQALFPNEAGESKKIIDFTQDAELIYSAFLQTYGIDLFKEQGKLRWEKFAALLSALPGDTRFSQIIEIRCQDIPAPTKYNKAQRENLIRLKAKYRVKLSEEERNKEYQSALRAMAEKLYQMARR